MDWIQVAQNWEKLRAFVRTVMNIRVLKTRTLPTAVEELSSAQEGLSCMKSVSRSVNNNNNNNNNNVY